MNRTNFISRYLASLLVIAAVSAQATTIAEWNFNEPFDTPLTGTVNSAGAGGTWEGDINAFSIITTGSGSLAISSNNTSAVQTYAPLGSAVNTNTILEATVFIKSWNFTGLVGTGPAFSFGFTSVNSTASSLVSRFGLFFNESTGVTFGGTGQTNGQNIATQALPLGLSLSQPIALRITLTYGSTANAGTYSIGYDLGSGFQTLTSGSATIGRESNFAVFRVSGDYAVAGSAMEIDRIQITTAAVPEPGTWVLLGLGLLGVFIARRRVKRA